MNHKNRLFRLFQHRQNRLGNFWRSDILLERAIAVGGVGVAATITTLSYMDAQYREGAPRINGADHLALFAKPALYHEEKIRTAERAPEPEMSIFDPIGPRPASRLPSDVDFDATASIRSPPRVDPPVSSAQDAQPEFLLPVSPKKQEAGSFQFRHADGKNATFSGPQGLRIFHVGEEVPGFGRIRSIVKKKGRYVAVFSR